eukprot:PhF_6_TR41512/c0_g1_i1/m.62903/K12589/RRP42, EXOSC7; exosome complex component RRP42
MQNQISPGEASYILHGISHGTRCDGRSRLQVRPMDITHGVVGRANGSAHVEIGGTEVVVGIYANVIPSRRGAMCIHVDCTPVAAWAYNPSRGTLNPKEAFTTAVSLQLSALYGAQRSSGGGGRGGGEVTVMAADVSAAANTEVETETIVSAPCHPAAYTPVPYDELVIQDGMSWNLNVDVMIVGCTGGNIIGAATVAIKAALMDLQLPRVEKSAQGGDVRLHNDVLTPFAGAQRCPVASLFLCTGSHFVADPTLQEESVPHTAVVVGATPEGAVCYVETVSVSSQVTSAGPVSVKDLMCVA